MTSAVSFSLTMPAARRCKVGIGAYLVDTDTTIDSASFRVLLLHLVDPAFIHTLLDAVGIYE